ncbi:MAG: CarD family transcriptional regulator, partial [Firmicutes bacterium]|nr:CarD family transcriptional regulator [Bacillota bacterium]
GIVSEDVVDTVKIILSAESTPMDINWNRRNRDNLEKLKTGDICQVAEVVRNLLRVDRVKTLSTGEKKMLQSARQILASEISLVQNKDESEVLLMIDSAV